jgi:hypothetical protein
MEADRLDVWDQPQTTKSVFRSRDAVPDLRLLDWNVCNFSNASFAALNSNGRFWRRLANGSCGAEGCCPLMVAESASPA